MLPWRRIRRSRVLIERFWLPRQHYDGGNGKSGKSYAFALPHAVAFASVNLAKSRGNLLIETMTELSSSPRKILLMTNDRQIIDLLAEVAEQPVCRLEVHRNLINALNTFDATRGC
jgi:hypothetical protein